MVGLVGQEIWTRPQPPPLLEAAYFALAGTTMQQDPYCLAMIICDHVHQDRATGKCTILGTFSAFNPTTFPVKAKFWIYAEMTDGVGDFGVSIRLTESSFAFDGEGENSESPLFSVVTPALAIKMDNPLAVYQFFIVVGVDLPKPGQYHCELLANEVPLMSRRLIVRPVPGPSTGTDDAKEE